MQNQHKNILILGAGFAGLHTALVLGKKLNRSDYKITLIDKQNVHLYTPDLYEIATNFHKKITEECLSKLKETVATPIAKIIHRLPITFIQDTVKEIKPGEKNITLQNLGIQNYEFLVITLGSVVNYYNIPGLEQFSYPLKTLADAMAINCHLDVYFQTLWKAGSKKHISIIIGGGGATGVEFAAECAGYIKKLCKKYAYPQKDVEIRIIDASNCLAGQDKKTTRVIKRRLQKLGVSIQPTTFIKEVYIDKIVIETKQTNSSPSQGEVTTSSSPSQGEVGWGLPSHISSIPKDILIWTGGVTPNPLIKKSFIHTAKNGSLPVDNSLQSLEYPNIYAAGDNACFIDQKTQKPAPMLAQIAFKQAKIIAENIHADINNTQRKKYQLELKGIIIPLGSTYAILKRNGRIYKGHLMWILRRLVDLNYYLSILPLCYSLRKWLWANKIFKNNDRER